MIWLSGLSFGFLTFGFGHFFEELRLFKLGGSCGWSWKARLVTVGI